tara:strand:- start:8375 stop:8653 length:279 start_codon:yes stop_codon:yes gene_type:complete
MRHEYQTNHRQTFNAAFDGRGARLAPPKPFAPREGPYRDPNPLQMTSVAMQQSALSNGNRPIGRQNGRFHNLAAAKAAMPAANGRQGGHVGC